ncbi:MAG: ribosomal protein S18-alanine N-acetyltransferase [Buchananella hordeovulneris]|nr:ribosomal protein S18-alanine N-acetyltransferase [Buchananella hordeovulneris]
MSDHAQALPAPGGTAQEGAQPAPPAERGGGAAGGASSTPTGVPATEAAVGPSGAAVGDAGISAAGADLEIVPLEPQDAAVLAVMDRMLFGAEAWGPGAFESELENPARAYLGLARGEELWGFGGISLYEDAELMTIGVLPQWQGKGQAGRLLDALLAAARAAGSRRVLLEVRSQNEAAQRLYRSRGFTQIAVRKRYYRLPTDDALVMELSLQAVQADLNELATTNRVRAEI